MAFATAVVAVAVCGAPSAGVAQQPSPPTEPRAEQHNDSTAHGDPASTDSAVAAARPFTADRAPVGSITERIPEPGYSLISDRDLVWRRYFTAFDVLSNELPAFAASQGSPGLVRAFSIAGASPSAISTLFNGRPLSDHAGIGYDLENMQLEFVERIEIARGARAALYGTGEALLALNFVGAEYDVEGSFARVAYSQGGYDLTSGDLTYARNLTNRSNLAVGLRRLTSDGLYQNQGVSNTALRASLRWNVPDGPELTLTEFYTDVVRGLSGGLTADSPLDPQNESVVDPTLSERQLRHDVTLAARWIPSGDSADQRPHGPRIDVAGYYSNVLRRLSSAEDAALHTGTAGVRAGMISAVGPIYVVANLIAELRHFVTEAAADRMQPFTAQAGALLEVPLGTAAVLRGGGRIDREERDALRTIGIAEVVLTPVGPLSARATLRSFHGVGLNTGDSVGLFGSFATTLLAEAAIDYAADGMRVGVEGFYRAVDAASSRAVGPIYGGVVRLATPVTSMAMVEAQLHASIAPQGDTRFPSLFGSGSAYVHGSSFDENLDWRIGAAAQWGSSLAGAEYEPQSGDLGFGTGASREALSLPPNLELFAQGRIGNAFIRAAVQNVLGSEFWTLYRYPVASRMIALQVTWTLID